MSNTTNYGESWNVTIPWDIQTTTVPTPQPPVDVCPGCGRCLHCGRGGQPQVNPWPYVAYTNTPSTPTWSANTIEGTLGSTYRIS